MGGSTTISPPLFLARRTKNEERRLDAFDQPLGMTPGGGARMSEVTPVGGCARMSEVEFDLSTDLPESASPRMANRRTHHSQTTAETYGHTDAPHLRTVDFDLDHFARTTFLDLGCDVDDTFESEPAYYVRAFWAGCAMCEAWNSGGTRLWLGWGSQGGVRYVRPEFRGRTSDWVGGRGRRCVR